MSAAFLRAGAGAALARAPTTCAVLVPSASFSFSASWR